MKYLWNVYITKSGEFSITKHEIAGETPVEFKVRISDRGFRFILKEEFGVYNADVGSYSTDKSEAVRAAGIWAINKMTGIKKLAATYDKTVAMLILELRQPETIPDE